MRESNNRCVIWDMDGVIADTGRYHFKGWQKVFKKRGVEFTAGDFKKHFGQRNDTIIRDTVGEQISKDELEVIAREKEEAYRDYAKGNIKALPGSIALLNSLKKKGFKIGLGSSAPPENIRLVLDSLEINGFFQAIVYGREVTEGKPSPQVYLLAAKKLGVEPEHCVVIEDALAGVAGAKRAGMHCIAVTNTHSRENLSQADLVVDTLEEVTVKDIEELIEVG